jgi:hypothetical protein
MKDTVSRGQKFLATVTAVSVRIGQMLRTVEFDRHASNSTEQIHFRASPSVERNGLVTQ